MSNGIYVENGKKHRCHKCKTTFAIENDGEILYRNITLLYFNSTKREAEVKCKQCKTMLKLDYSNFKGKVIDVEA